MGALQPYSVATQICKLLNEQNDLSIKYVPEKILNSPTKYIFTHHNGLIGGVVGIEKNNYLMTRIKHLSVASNICNRGIGTELVTRALAAVDTKFSYCTIKEDNEKSLKIFKKAGFYIIGDYLSWNNKVLLFLRTNPVTPGI